MHNKFIKLFLGVLVSLFFIILAYFFFDIFLLDYESLFNYLAFKIGKSESLPPNLSDINFGVINPIILLQKKFSDLNFYAIFKLFTLGLIIFSFCIIFFSAKFYKYSIVFIITAIFMCLDLFVFIHTNKLIVLLVLLSLIQLHTQKNTITSIFFILFLSILSILIRVDLAFVLIAFSFFISILYFKKINVKFHFIVLLLSILGLSVFINKVIKNTDELKNFHTVERAIQDRMDFVLDKPSEDTTLNKQEMIMYGMGMFLLDKEVQKNIPYASLVKHSSLKEYIFSNPNFLNIYFNKLNDLWEHIKTRYFISFFLSLISVFFIGFFHWKLKIPSWKFGVALLAYIGLPLAINTIAIINISFFSVYLLIPFFAVYVLCLKHYSNTKRLSVLHLFLFFVALSNFYFFILPEIKNFKEMEANKLLVMEAFKEDNKNGNTPIVTYIDYDYFLPSSIKFNYKDIDFVFLDAGAYNTLEHFKKMHFKNFGENYTSFLTRFEKAVATNGYLYSSKSTFEFMILYLKRVHDIDVRFQPVEKFGDIDFYKYEINAIAKIN